MARRSPPISRRTRCVQWGFYAGTDEDRTRIRYENGALVLRAKGQTPANSAPLSFVTGDHAYEVEVTIDRDPDATAGLLLSYSRKLYAGLGISSSRFVLHRYETERLLERPAGLGGSLRLRLRNDRHIVTISYSVDGTSWTRFGTALEVSGYHHNVAGEFLSLRPAIYAAGTGEVRFRQFVYRALE
jgi:xylan 1,4-beta-xylosidase